MNRCYDYALNYIYRFPKTEKELRIQLYQKGFLSSDIDETMTLLKKKGFVDDKTFTDMYLRSEVINRGKPLLRAIKKLQEKGVDSRLIKEASIIYQAEIQEGIYIKIGKEIQSYKRKGVDGFDIIQKLMRKGYVLDDIKAVIESKKN